MAAGRSVEAYEPRPVNRQRRTNAELAEVDRCNWAGCEIPLTYVGRGRPPEYCPEHAKASKKRLDKARPVGGRTRKRYDGCCLDAQAAKVRAYGTRTIRYPDWRGEPFYELYVRVAKVGSARVKTAKVRVCPQHQQWRAFYGRSRERFLAQSSELRDEKNNPQIAELAKTQAFRLTVNHPDDYIVPDPRMEIEMPAGACDWCGARWPETKSGYDAKLEAMAREWLDGARN